MTRIQLIAIVVLWSIACLQFVTISSLPDIDSVLDVQISLQSLVNQLNFDHLKNSAQAGIRSGEQIHDQHAVQAVNELRQASAYADSITKTFDLLAAGEVTTGKAAQRTNELRNLNKVAIADTTPLNYAIRQINTALQESNSISDRKVRVLAIENIRSNNFDLIRAWVDSLTRLTASVQIQFNTELSHRENTWKKGLIAFNPRKNMEVGEKERVQIRISKDLRNDILERMPSSERAEIDSLKVGDVMIVRLTGDEFDITPFDEEEQGVTDEGYTQWEYEVTPKASGQHNLFVKVGIVYTIPGIGPSKKFFPVYEKEIQIHTDTWKRISSFTTERWEFLVSTFLIPAFTWAWSRFRKRK